MTRSLVSLLLVRSSPFLAWLRNPRCIACRWPVDEPGKRLCDWCEKKKDKLEKKP